MSTQVIGKVCEADPLECPRCKGLMRVIALIDDPRIVQRLLEHLGAWAPEPAERDPKGHESAAIGQRRQTSRIDFPIFACICPIIMLTVAGLMAGADFIIVRTATEGRI